MLQWINYRFKTFIFDICRTYRCNYVISTLYYVLLGKVVKISIRSIATPHRVFWLSRYWVLIWIWQVYQSFTQNQGFFSWQSHRGIHQIRTVPYNPQEISAWIIIELLYQYHWLKYIYIPLWSHRGNHQIQTVPLYRRN